MTKKISTPMNPPLKMWWPNKALFGHHIFKGGFIGVDIFFVISGYLITSIILKELITTGTFSFKYFYERRIRRILPVLLVVILANITTNNTGSILLIRLS